MKNMFRFSALLCAMAVLVTSCTQDETLEPQVKPAADGSEILFGARAGFENAGSYMIVGLVGVNFLIELVLNIILSSAIIRIINYSKSGK